MVVGGLFVFNALMLMAVLGWQKWGAFGAVIATAAQAILLWQGGVSPLGAVLFLVVAMTPLIALLALLTRGGGQSAWLQME